MDGRLLYSRFLVGNTDFRVEGIYVAHDENTRSVTVSRYAVFTDKAWCRLHRCTAETRSGSSPGRVSPAFAKLACANIIRGHTTCEFR